MPSARVRILVLTVNRNNTVSEMLLNASKGGQNRLEVLALIENACQANSQLVKYEPSVALTSAEPQVGSDAVFNMLQSRTSNPALFYSTEFFPKELANVTDRGFNRED